MLANNQFIYKGQPSFLAKLFLSHYLLDCVNESKSADADSSISPALGVEGTEWVCSQLDLGPRNLILVSAICNIYKHFSVSQHLYRGDQNRPWGSSIGTPDSPKELCNPPPQTEVIVYRAFCMPGTLQSVLHLILTVTLGSRCCYYPHFIGGETESQRD